MTEVAEMDEIIKVKKMMIPCSPDIYKRHFKPVVEIKILN